MVLAVSLATAQEPPHWRYWLASDGLEESCSLTVSIGPAGLVWVNHGHVDKMSVLDGYTVANLPNPGVGAPVIETNDHILWSCDSHCFLRYSSYPNRMNADWERFPVPGLPSKAPPFCPLSPDHVLYTSRDRVMAFDARKNQSGTFFSFQESLGAFNDLLHSQSGGIWLACEKGLAFVEKEIADRMAALHDGAYAQYIPPDSLNISGFTSLHEGRNGELFATATQTGTSDHTLVRFFKGEWECLGPTSPAIHEGWRGFEDSVWIRKDNTLTHFEDGQEHTLEKNRVLSRVLSQIASQPDGAFWIATSEGLAHHTPSTWRTPAPVSDINRIVHSMLEDASGRVWFACADALLLFDNETWKRYQLHQNQVTQELLAESLCLLGDGHLILQTNTTGLLIFDPQSETFHSIEHPNAYEIGAIATARHTDTNGIWAAATNKQVFQILHYDGKSFHTVEEIPFTHLLDSDLRHIYRDTDGTFWLGGLRGLIHIYEGKAVQVGEQDGYTDSSANCIVSPLPGEIWVGGRDKVMAYKEGKWREVLSGLDGVRSIFAAQDQSIWIASGTGLHRWYHDSWVTNDAADGLPDAALYAVFEDSHRRLWAGATSGLSLYHQEADTDPPRTTIPPNRNPDVIAPEGGQFNFEAVDKWKYTAPERLLYSFRIDNGPWSGFKSEKVAVLNHLPAGEHTLEVRAMDRNWNIEPEPARYPFKVLLPWYRHPGFQIVFLVGVVVILILLAMHVHHHLRVESLVRERTRDLQTAYNKLLDYQDELRSLAAELSQTEERERRTIASDLHDTIGQALSLSIIKIQGLQELSPKDTQSALDEVQNLLDKTLRESRSLMFQICPPILYELGLEAAIEQLAKQIEKQHDLKIDVRDDGKDKPVSEDARYFLFRAVREILINVSKHAQTDHAIISLARADDRLHIEITDRGIGMVSAHALRAGKSEGGFGLFSIRERLNELGGELQIKSQSGHGTTVTIISPLHRHPGPGKDMQS